MTHICRNCEGIEWVCENHKDRPWGGASTSSIACDCGAGAPCPVCNMEMACAGLLDVALSAERERGDRAVSSRNDYWPPEIVTAVQGVRSWLDFALREEWTPDSHALACHAQDRLDKALATQKAEGATSTPATTDDSPPPR